MLLRVAVLTASALSFAPLAAAAEPPPRAPLFRVGVHTGWAVPLGATEKDVPLHVNAAGQIPVGVDLGVRVARPVIVGLYAQYGAVITRSSNDWTSVCQIGQDCSGSDVHLGVQAHYHFAPGQRLDPWLGMGIGYETYTLHAAGTRFKWSGIEVANVQIGLDVGLGRVISVGPFLGLAMAQFSKLDVTPADQGFSGPVQNPGIHDWFCMGARGSVDFL